MATAKLEAARAQRPPSLERADLSALTQQDIQTLVEQLQLHQIELEMQNEELRQMQVELEMSRSQYKELFDRAPVGYVALTTDGRVLQANAAARAMLQHGHERVVGRFFAELVRGADRTTFWRHLRDAAESELARCELRVHVTPGSLRQYELQTSYVSGPQPHHLMLVTDVSERARYMERLRDMNTELQAEIDARVRSEQAKHELEVQLRQAERLESLGMLAAGIAHDFNNLLVGVVSGAELLMRSPELPETHREQLRLIGRAGQEAAALTRQLLVFAGQEQTSKSAVDVRGLVHECRSLLLGRSDGEVSVLLKMPQELPPVHADRVQLHQVLVNLITNAMEAVKPSGCVGVRTRVDALSDADLAQFSHPGSAVAGDFVVIEVADSGPGIESSNLAHIFDPFFSTKFTGRGLGLATVLGIVQGHGGALHVQTLLGCGTTFEVALPVAEARPATSTTPPPRSDFSAAAAHVMLVDDDTAVRNIVKLQLEALGLSVSAFSNGRDALRDLQTDAKAFGLFVLDWLMPEVSGQQVYDAVRRVAPQSPVIVITGYSKASLGIEDPRVLCLQKPFTLQELEAAVRQSTPQARLAVSA